LIDHTGINVANYEKSKSFYLKALAPIGYTMILEFGFENPDVNDVGGFGEVPKTDFWVAKGQPNVPPLHIAFRAKTRAQVDAFYAAAIEAGGIDNGAPGLRPHYHSNYYGAFVRDFDGHNIEVVCHGG
jgi:catechol 2,3-dioxygenase-like lactoylglutathione lyase family enzyme